LVWDNSPPSHSGPHCPLESFGKQTKKKKKNQNKTHKILTNSDPCCVPDQCSWGTHNKRLVTPSRHSIARKCGLELTSSQGASSFIWECEMSVLSGYNFLTETFYVSLVWQGTSVIPAHKRLRQEDL
jgi:hypothetical protein